MRILLTGAGGQFGASILRELTGVRAVTAWTGTRAGQLFGTPFIPVDLANLEHVTAAFHEAAPELVLHAAALARIADCQRDPERARRVNVEGTAVLADLCSRANVRLVYVSTDMVFDGTRGNYGEADTPAPLSEYGRTKAAAEQVVLKNSRNAVLRFSLLYGPSLNGRQAFFDEQLTALRTGRPVTLFADEWRTPLDLATAARALLDVARSDYHGLLHIGGPERLSRAEMGRRLAAFLGLDGAPLIVTTRDQAPAAEPRPRDLSLDSSCWRGLFPNVPRPRLEEALRNMGLASAAL